MGGVVQETGEAHTGFWWGNLSRRDRLEDFGVHGRATLMDLQEVQLKGMDWIDLAQDKERWEPLMNAVMNICTL